MNEGQGRERHEESCQFRSLVALARCGDLLFCAKHLFVAAMGGSLRYGCGMGEPGPIRQCGKNSLCIRGPFGAGYTAQAIAAKRIGLTF